MATSRLPKAVREASERADDLLKSLAEKVDQVSENPLVAPIVEPPKEEPPVVPVTDDKDSRYWEHRCKTVQGMLDAEKSRTNNSLSDLKRQLEVMKEEASLLKTKLVETTNQVPRQYDLRKYMSETEINTYGEDLLTVMMKTAAKLAEEQVSSRVNTEIENQVKPIRDKLNLTEQDNAQIKSKTFWASLEASVPDWMQINSNPQFHQWLSEVDPLYGDQRQKLLSEAEQQLNVDRVVAFFNLFKTIVATSKPPVRDVSTKVVPESAPASLSVNPNEGSVTLAEMQQFHLDKIRGRYNGRAKDREAMERKIDAAIAAGKIIA